ncbi:PucR family transcriptional regulator [Mycolicibacterium smegmatis]|uniref:Regulatory protein n=1 Tax=Mycolicibacterium smegmatis (strain MKD8) TaxID=1214915 RepID=A0A2U9PUI1_MYCSE|nr:PucR family transcriptional regulator ligand-binding domain-containing protein [Mycolicibacterium smegmatis]AWT55394.1 regulatory protein [Mycolicibacterium smegmatis MKD8]
MSLSVREVLDHPLLRPAEPVVRSGAGALDVTVRWVHSADLVDIAPLLRGGEALLTNGVGLVSVDVAGRRRYVRSLAEIGIAALLFEVGRTFPSVPEEMVDEACDTGLTVVELKPALRFTEVAETVNSELIDRSVVRLRHADETSRALSVALAKGASLAELLAQVAASLGTWAQLLDRAGRTVAEAGRMHPGDGPSADAPVLVDGVAWGRLVIGTAGAPELLGEAVLDRAPTVLGLCLIREHKDLAGALRTQQILLEQLVGNRSVAKGVLQARMQTAGLAVAGHEYVCIAVDTHRVRSAEGMVDAAIRQCGHGIFGVVAGRLCALVTRPRDESSRNLAEDVRRAVDGAMRGQRQACVAVGRVVRDVADLPRAMTDTYGTLSLGQDLHLFEPVIGVQELSLQRLLNGFGDREVLRQFVDDQIGVLLEADSDKGGHLIHTLEVLISCNGSKAEAAKRLHLRRQSLYYRLERIERLTGADLGDPQHLLPITVALTVHKMLSPA